LRSGRTLFVCSPRCSLYCWRSFLVAVTLRKLRRSRPLNSQRSRRLEPAGRRRILRSRAASVGRALTKRSSYIRRPTDGGFSPPRPISLSLPFVRTPPRLAQHPPALTPPPSFF